MTGRGSWSKLVVCTTHAEGPGTGAHPAAAPPEVLPGAMALCPATPPPETKQAPSAYHRGLQRAFIYLVQSIHCHNLLCYLLLK